MLIFRTYTYGSLALFLSLLLSCSSEVPPYQPENELEALTAKLGGFSEYEIVKNDSMLILESGNEMALAKPERRDSLLTIAWQHGKKFGEVHTYLSVYQATANGGWEPLFPDTLVPGELKQILDLNEDGRPEFLVDRPFGNGNVPVGEFVLYRANPNGAYRATEPLASWECGPSEQGCSRLRFLVREVGGNRYLEGQLMQHRQNEDGIVWSDTSYYVFEWAEGDLQRTSMSYLLVEKPDTWMMNQPEDGDVIRRLPRGETLEMLEKGPYAYTNGRGDYWYQVQHKDMSGWVFGAHTSWAQWAQYELESFNGLVKLLVKQLENPPSGLTDSRCSISYFFLNGHAVVARNCHGEASAITTLYAFQLPLYQFTDVLDLTEAQKPTQSGEDWYQVNANVVYWNTDAGKVSATLNEQGKWVMQSNQP